MENYYFFDSNTSIGDRRLYSAADWSKVLSKFLENGIYNEGDNLAVTANGTGMTVNVGLGVAFINGHMYENTDSLPLAVDAAEASLDRIDLVVLRLDISEQNRYIKAFVKKGEAASSPVSPIVEDTTFVKEIALAEIRVTAAKSTIDQVQITDKRPADFVDPFVDGARITALENGTVWKNGEQYMQGPLSISEQPYLESNKTASATIQPSTWTKVQNIGATNIGGGTWNNGDYTVPLDGVYLCVLSAYVDGLTDGKTVHTAVYKNGSLSNENRLEQRQASGTADGMLIGSTFLKCNLGDILSFYVFHGDTVARSLVYAHMKIIKLT